MSCLRLCDGNERAVVNLLGVRARPNSCDRDERPVAYLAASHNYGNILSLLLMQGVDMKELRWVNGTQTNLLDLLLDLIADGGYEETVAQLMPSSSDLIKPHFFPLHRAAEKGKYTAVQVLHKHGASLESKYKGQCPIHWQHSRDMRALSDF